MAADSDINSLLSIELFIYLFNFFFSQCFSRLRLHILHPQSVHRTIYYNEHYRLNLSTKHIDIEWIHKLDGIIHLPQNSNRFIFPIVIGLGPLLMSADAVSQCIRTTKSFSTLSVARYRFLFSHCIGIVFILSAGKRE